MATGPEHYRIAEGLVAPTTDPASGIIPITVLPSPQMIAAAQVHATLALAAATALGTWNETGMPQPDRRNWWLAASGEPEERRSVREANAAEAAEFEEAQS